MLTVHKKKDSTINIYHQPHKSSTTIINHKCGYECNVFISYTSMHVIPRFRISEVYYWLIHSSLVPLRTTWPVTGSSSNHLTRHRFLSEPETRYKTEVLPIFDIHDAWMQQTNIIIVITFDYNTLHWFLYEPKLNMTISNTRS